MRWVALTLAFALSGCQSDSNAERDTWLANIKMSSKRFDDCALRNYRAYRISAHPPDHAAEAAMTSCGTEERAFFEASIANPRIPHELASRTLAEHRARLKTDLIQQ